MKNLINELESMETPVFISYPVGNGRKMVDARTFAEKVHNHIQRDRTQKFEKKIHVYGDLGNTKDYHIVYIEWKNDRFEFTIDGRVFQLPFISPAFLRDIGHGELEWLNSDEIEIYNDLLFRTIDRFPKHFFTTLKDYQFKNLCEYFIKYVMNMDRYTVKSLTWSICTRYEFHRVLKNKEFEMKLTEVIRKVYPDFQDYEMARAPRHLYDHWDTRMAALDYKYKGMSPSGIKSMWLRAELPGLVNWYVEDAKAKGIDFSVDRIRSDYRDYCNTIKKAAEKTQLRAVK